MGIFDDLTKRAAAFQADVEKSLMGSGSKKKGGQVLGTKKTESPGHKLSESSAATRRNTEKVVAKFTESGVLGMTISRGATNLPEVTVVVPNGAADTAGICVGDIITNLNGKSVEEFEGCMKLLKKNERPLDIVLSRQLSEREARRAAQAKAALERDGAWSRRVASRPQGGKVGTPKPITPAEEAKLSNPETRAAWEAAAQRHAEQTRELGYDPYKPLLTGTSAASSASSQSARPPPTTTKKRDATPGTRLGGNPDQSGDYDTAYAEVEIAIQALTSYSETSDASAQEACINTLLKLLDNALNKSDEKFKRVRLANANIQAKILALDGGLEVLIAAGFQLLEDGDETVLQLPNNFSRPRCQAVTDALTQLKK